MDEREVKRNRGTVSLAFVDNNVSISTAICGSLQALGYRNIKVFRDVASLDASLFGPGFDIIIGDADMEEGALLNVVRRLRNGEHGRNPFAAFIVTTWNHDWATVRRAIDAGVDDILVNPISPGGLLERIQAIVSNRKPFIVTSDYTGPERRRDPNRVSNIPAFEPPNSLSEKELGTYTGDADLKWRVDNAAREISAEKLRRVVFQLAFLQGLASIALNRDNRPDVATETLGWLGKQARRAHHLAMINGEPELTKHTSKMIQIVDEMNGGPPMHSGVSVLRREADKLLSKVFTEDRVKDMRTDVDLAIRAFELRRQSQYEAAD